MIRTRPPIGGARVGVCLCFALALACNSDLDLDESATSTGTSTSTSTGTSTSTTDDETTTTTTTTGDATTGEPEPEQTCRDALQCIGLCAIQLDLECFQMCTQGLPPEEGQKALQLGLCIGMECFTNGSCTIDDPMNQACIACVGLGLLSPKPPGCEGEAAACM